MKWLMSMWTLGMGQAKMRWCGASGQGTYEKLQSRIRFFAYNYCSVYMCLLGNIYIYMLPVTFTYLHMKILCIYTQSHNQTHTHSHSHTHTYIHIYIHADITYTWLYIYMSVYIIMYICTCPFGTRTSKLLDRRVTCAIFQWALVNGKCLGISWEITNKYGDIVGISWGCMGI